MRRQLCAAGIAIAAVLFQSSFAFAETLPEHWYAFHTKTLFVSTAGDAAPAGTQPMRPGWRFDVTRSWGAAVWDARVAVTTSRDPATLSWWPAISYDTATKTYSRTGRTDAMFTSVSTMPPETESGELGFTAGRLMVEGRDIAGGAEVTRTLRVTATPIGASRAIVIGVSLYSPTSPVQVVSASCAGAAGDARWQSWYLVAPAASVAIERECALVLQNTSSLPARYAPFVSVTAIDGIARLDTIGAASFVVSDGLGTTALEVTPPLGVTPYGHLDQYEERTVGFDQVNRTTAQSWAATYVRSSSTSTSGDAITASMSVARGSNMLVQSWIGANQPAPTFPAHIQLTSSRTLSLYPDPSERHETPDGTVYRWNGLTPMLSANAYALRPPVTGSIGFTADRALEGGRLVPAHTSATRTITVHVSETEPLLSLTTFIALDPSYRPLGFPASLSVTDATCPGSVQQYGHGGTWPLLAPATSYPVSCTFTLANTGDVDALYMPAVFISAERSRSEAPPVLGASTLSLTDPDLGSIDWSVDVPSGLTPNGALVQSERLSAMLSSDARGVPHDTALQLDAPANPLFGTAIPADITLTDTTAGTPIANARLRLELQGPSGTSTSSSTTGTDGSVRWTLPRSLLPGAYTLRAWYDGDDRHAPATASRMIQVTETDGRVTAAGRGSTGTAIALEAIRDGTRRVGKLVITSDTFTFHGIELLALAVAPDGHHAALALRDQGGAVAYVAVENDPAARVHVTVAGFEPSGDGTITGHVVIVP